MNGSVSGSIPDMLEGGLSGYVRAIGGGGSTVIVSPEIIEDGTLICTITVNSTPYYIYAPTPPSAVSFSRTLSDGTKIGEITIGNVTTDIYAPTPITPEVVTVTPTLTDGTKIGTITIGTTSVDLYAPTPSSNIVYLNTEHIVGTWLDGRPLYEKTLESSQDFSSGTKSITDNDWINADMLMIIDGFITSSTSSGEYNLPMNYHEDSSYYTYSGYRVYNHSIFIRCAGFSSSKATFTVRYTKTTDIPS